MPAAIVRKSSMAGGEENRPKTGKASDKKPLLPTALRSSNKLPRRRSFGLLKPSKKQALADARDEEAEEDPVMALFNARTTQRVRFSLEEQPKYEKQVDEEAASKSSSSSIKKFMKGALFGRAKDFDVEQAMKNENVWEGATTTAEVVKPRPVKTSSTAFVENHETRAAVTKLLNKANRAQAVHFRYEYAVKCCLKALELLNGANYPDDHPTVTKTMQSLNNAHHALSSYQNSANIVKMGIKYEDAGDLVRSLKYYTIAYRIRRDNLSPSHPSLTVLLNMLGGIQVKRDELEEAMEIYELALKDAPILQDCSESADRDEMPPPLSSNLLARAVAHREMGTIHERWGDAEEALNMYQRSLDDIAEYKGIDVKKTPVVEQPSPPRATTEQPSSPTSVTEDDILLDLESVHLSRAFAKHTAVVRANKNEHDGDESGGMELFIGSSKKDQKSTVIITSSCYDSFFPPSLDQQNRKKRERKTDNADVEVALTLHQIGQLHRAEGEYNLALAAYTVALRGMKYALGRNHPNVAAILGNIGNLQKEMGDMTAAFETYQQVLAIESFRLGLSHPDVAITLHNIATIDAARGNYEHALTLYMQVLGLQRRLFGEDHVSLAVTSACMGDVYERIGDVPKALHCFEESLRIKTAALGRHSLEVARILHKLGKLCVLNGDHHLADSYLSRTVLIYRLNKLADDDEWLVDANRDIADIDAVIAMGRSAHFEC